MKKKLYHYTECGLDYVYLANGFKVHKTPYGEAVEVENAAKLDQSLALFIIRRQNRLTGQEVRFLRGLLDLTQTDLGEYLGKDAQTVARWEKGKTALPSLEDRLLRQVYLEKSGHQQPFIKTSEQVKALKERLKEVLFAKSPRAWAEAV